MLPVVSVVGFILLCFCTLQHDPDSKECQPSTGGKYIMYDKATPGYEPNNRRFSKCSIGRMVPVISK